MVGRQFDLGRLGDFAIQIVQSDGEMESVHGRQVDNRLGTCQLRFRGWDRVWGGVVPICENWGNFGIRIA